MRISTAAVHDEAENDTQNSALPAGVAVGTYREIELAVGTKANELPPVGMQKSGHEHSCGRRKKEGPDESILVRGLLFTYPCHISIGSESNTTCSKHSRKFHQ